MAVVAYARVSTQDQDLSGQIEALTAAGATSIFKEKVGGARADRPQLAKLIAQGWRYGAQMTTTDTSTQANHKCFDCNCGSIQPAGHKHAALARRGLLCNAIAST